MLTPKLYIKYYCEGRNQGYYKKQKNISLQYTNLHNEDTSTIYDREEMNHRFFLNTTIMVDPLLKKTL